MSAVVSELESEGDRIRGRSVLALGLATLAAALALLACGIGTARATPTLTDSSAGVDLVDSPGEDLTVQVFPVKGATGQHVTLRALVGRDDVSMAVSGSRCTPRRDTRSTVVPITYAECPAGVGRIHIDLGDGTDTLQTGDAIGGGTYLGSADDVTVACGPGADTVRAPAGLSLPVGLALGEGCPDQRTKLSLGAVVRFAGAKPSLVLSVQSKVAISRLAGTLAYASWPGGTGVFDQRPDPSGSVAVPIPKLGRYPLVRCTKRQKFTASGMGVTAYQGDGERLVFGIYNPSFTVPRATKGSTGGRSSRCKMNPPARRSHQGPR